MRFMRVSFEDIGPESEAARVLMHPGPLAEKILGLFKKQNLILPDGRLSIPMSLSGPTGKPEVDDIITQILEKALISALIPGL